MVLVVLALAPLLSALLMNGIGPVFVCADVESPLNLFSISMVGGLATEAGIVNETGFN